MADEDTHIDDRSADIASVMEEMDKENEDGDKETKDSLSEEKDEKDEKDVKDDDDGDDGESDDGEEGDGEKDEDEDDEGEGEGDGDSDDGDDAKDEDDEDDESSVKSAAPESWRPVARELWSKIPPEARQEIEKREKETSAVLQDSANARRVATEFQSAVRPYVPMLQAQGVRTPTEAINLAFETMSQLSLGTTQGKAQAVVGLIAKFGVDIATIDDILTDNQKSGGDVQSLVEAAVAPFKAKIEEYEGNRTKGVDNSISNEIQEFAKSHEFFNDLRQDIAFFLKQAKDSGKQMTLEQAYTKAAKYNEDISGIIKKREGVAQEKKSKAEKRKLAKKKKAALSISGNRSGDKSKGKNKVDDLRGDLEEAMDQVANQ